MLTTDGFRDTPPQSHSPMSDAKSRLRADLPNFPEEVVTHWLDEYAENPGWPPQPDYLINPQNRWNALLRYKSVGWWQTVKWQLEQLKPEELPFNEESLENIHGVGAAFLSPVATKYSFIHDLKPRCASILRYMLENGAFPVPVFVVCERGVYDIADGAHRLAVYWLMLANFETRARLTKDQPCWVAYAPNS